jgi:hypothetical protein
MTNTPLRSARYLSPPDPRPLPRHSPIVREKVTDDQVVVIAAFEA